MTEYDRQQGKDPAIEQDFSWTQKAIITLAFLIYMVPYYLTHAIQEDSYITFRSAFHLADHGQLAYNLGEHITAVTSTLYGPYVAFFRVAFHDRAIGAVLIANTILVVVAVLLISRVFFRDRSCRLLMVVFTLMAPVTIQICTKAMETPLQVLDLAFIAYTLRDGKPSWRTLLGIALLPAIRPDAVGYALICTVLIFLFDRIYGALSLACVGMGTGSVLLYNRLMTGMFVTSTARAKTLTYHPSHSLSAMAERCSLQFVRESILAPLPITNLQRLGFLWTFAVILCIALLLRQSWSDRPQRLLLLTFVVAGFTIPLAFAAGGVVFPWYVWTSAWLLTLFVAATGANLISSAKPRARMATTVVLLLCAFGLDAGYWLLAETQGLQDFHYRADVGRLIHQIAAPGDTLLLEPAGYIPFFAGIYTADDTGLVSAEVLRYRERFAGKWYIHYVQDVRPTFVVERPAIAVAHVWGDVTLDDAEWGWFTSHYRLVRHFQFSADSYVHAPLLKRLLRNARMDEFFLYERVDKAPTQ
jgi:hypothetical protein